MSINSRLASLEKQTRRTGNAPTWRDFVTGHWIPSPEDWINFLGGSPDAYAQLKAWANSVSDADRDALINGDHSQELRERVLATAPAELIPVLDNIGAAIVELQHEQN